MKKIIAVPDSFKGSLSAVEVCKIIEEAVKRNYPDCEFYAVPMADGGEGTVDAFLYALGGEKTKLMVCGPFMEKVKSFYGTFSETAVIEHCGVKRTSDGKGQGESVDNYDIRRGRDGPRRDKERISKNHPHPRRQFDK